MLNIKLNNHLEDTPVNVPLIKPNAEKCVLRERERDIYLFLKYYFAS